MNLGSQHATAVQPASTVAVQPASTVAVQQYSSSTAVQQQYSSTAVQQYSSTAVQQHATAARVGCTPWFAWSVRCTPLYSSMLQRPESGVHRGLLRIYRCTASLASGQSRVYTVVCFGSTVYTAVDPYISVALQHSLSLTPFGGGPAGATDTHITIPRARGSAHAPPRAVCAAAHARAARARDCARALGVGAYARARVLVTLVGLDE